MHIVSIIAFVVLFYIVQGEYFLDSIFLDEKVGEIAYRGNGLVNEQGIGVAFFKRQDDKFYQLVQQDDPSKVAVERVVPKDPVTYFLVDEDDSMKILSRFGYYVNGSVFMYVSKELNSQEVLGYIGKDGIFVSVGDDGFSFPVLLPGGDATKNPYRLSFGNINSVCLFNGTVVNIFENNQMISAKANLLENPSGTLYDYYFFVLGDTTYVTKCEVKDGSVEVFKHSTIGGDIGDNPVKANYFNGMVYMISSSFDLWICTLFDCKVARSGVKDIILDATPSFVSGAKSFALYVETETNFGKMTQDNEFLLFAKEVGHTYHMLLALAGGLLVNDCLETDCSLYYSNGIEYKKIGNAIWSLSVKDEYLTFLDETKKGFIPRRAKLYYNGDCFPACVGKKHCSKNRFVCECEHSPAGIHHFGLECKETFCFGMNSSDPEVCSGNGKCNSWNTCQCNKGFYNYNCQTSSEVLSRDSASYFMLSAILIFGVISFLLVNVLVCFHYLRKPSTVTNKEIQKDDLEWFQLFEEVSDDEIFLEESSDT